MQNTTKFDVICLRQIHVHIFFFWVFSTRFINIITAILQPIKKGVLQGPSLLQQLGQFSLARLQIRVATDVLLVDEDVGDGALVGDLLQSVLNGSAVLFIFLGGFSLYFFWFLRGAGGTGFACVLRTDLIQLESEVRGTHAGQKRLGRFAVRAVGFREDD